MRIITKLAIAAVLLALPLSLLTAQAPVKTDLLKMLEAVPAPPASSKEAFVNVASSDTGGNITYSAVKVFAAADQQLKGFEDTYTGQAKEALGGIPAGMPGGGMTEADAKKIQSLSKEQKIAMAMAMAGTMNQPVQIEPPLVKAAQEAWMVLYGQTQKEFQRGVALQQEEGLLEEEYRMAHSGLRKTPLKKRGFS